VWLDYHQTRSATEEDFIGGNLFDLRSDYVVQDGQQGLGLQGRGMGPTPQLGHAGRVVLEQRQQQPSGDGQADTFGLCRGREAGELVRIEDDGMLELLVEMIAFGAEPVVILRKVVQLLTVVGAIHGLHNAWRVPVKRLPAGARECGLSGNGTVGSVEDGGSVGDA
jgi:hypothetical protein